MLNQGTLCVGNPTSTADVVGVVEIDIGLGFADTAEGICRLTEKLHVDEGRCVQRGADVVNFIL